MLEEQHQDREENQEIALQARGDPAGQLNRPEGTEDGDPEHGQGLALEYPKQEERAGDQATPVTGPRNPGNPNPMNFSTAPAQSIALGRSCRC